MLQLFLQAPAATKRHRAARLLVQEMAEHPWKNQANIYKSKSDLQKKSTNKNILLESIVAHWIFSGQNLAQITLARSLKQHGGWISSDIVGTAAPETFLCHKEQRYVY